MKGVPSNTQMNLSEVLTPPSHRSLQMTDKPILVCARVKGPLMMPDNREGRCDVCGSRLQYRPHAPPSILRCMECAIDLIGPDDTLATTTDMIKDFEAYMKGKRQ